MVRVVNQLQDKDQEEDERRKIEGDQNGGQKFDGHRDVTITEIEDVGSTINGPSYPVDASYPEDRGTDAVCVRTEPDVQIRDGEDVSCISSTQYSDVDDSLEGSESNPWSNDLGLPVSLEQNFDNGVSLPIGEAPTFGDVCVKNSANIHFGNKTFYNGPVTIKQIVYSNPYSVEDKVDSDDVNNTSDNLPKERTDSQNSEEFHKVTEWCNWMLTWRCVALMCAVGSCLVATVVVSVVFLSQGSEVPPIPSPTLNPNDSSINIDVLPLNKLKFVDRVLWGAQPPTKDAPKLKHPVPNVIISQTSSFPCSTQSECTFRVRLAQTYDIESLNLTDIASNFMIGGDGYAYVGRGWDSVADGLVNYDQISIGISFIGTFATIVPPELQLRAAQQLIELGVKERKIAPDYKLLGLRQIARNKNPGDALYSIIQKWPNWSSEP